MRAGSERLFVRSGMVGRHGAQPVRYDLNSARLGVTSLVQTHTTSAARRSVVRDASVKPDSDPRTSVGLLSPPPGCHARSQVVGTRCSAPGRFKTAYLQSAQPPPTFLRLCG